MKPVSFLGILSVLVLLAGCQTPAPTATGTRPTTPSVAAPTPANASGEIIIDCKDPSFKTTGTWKDASDADDFKGGIVWATAADTETATATWTPVIKTAGLYAVYEWHGSDPSNDHGTNAPFTITYDGNAKTIPVDLRSNIGKWNLLGTFKFAAGSSGNVTLSNKANGNVIADAIKFVPQK